jgi:hypothetical protein
VVWQFEELKSFLFSEIEMRQVKPVVFLVDALDECDESEVRKVVSFFEELSIVAVEAKNLPQYLFV